MEVSCREIVNHSAHSGPTIPFTPDSNASIHSKVICFPTSKMKLNIASAILFASAMAHATVVDILERAVDPIDVLEKTVLQVDTVGKAVNAFYGTEDQREDLHDAGVSCVVGITALSKSAAEVDPLTEEQGNALRDPAMALLKSTNTFLDNLDGKLNFFEEDGICVGISDVVKMIETGLHDVLGNLTAKTSEAIQKGANEIIHQMETAFAETLTLLEGCPPPSTSTPSPTATPTTSTSNTSDSSVTTSDSSATHSAQSTSTPAPAAGSAGQLQRPYAVLVAAIAVYVL
ncbi:hypothetical protein NLU13_3987 [Sarocladium strictum]|uniref:Uncharacterized protein n=1 Tax=Sarocladium strictum TaxID=5046 RepID=A0AA39GI19_SARSR|nr:hypothetical protein NLU13_3987 [Sarocladium strictum]